MRRTISGASAATLFVLAALANFGFASQSPDPRLAVEKISLAKTATGGFGNTRGPAMTTLKSGEVLLGGGSPGGAIFLFDPKSSELRSLGNLIARDQRPDDPRFAITDIAVLSQSPTSARLLASYPRLGSSRQSTAKKDCVEVVVDELSLNRVTNKLTRAGNWFTSKPCVPISAVQHAAGRLLATDPNTAYLTIGDLGHPEINDRKVRGDLGKIFEITKNKVTEVSQGHRNAQGILLDNRKRLLISEHGPRGGDELNLIERGRDYGWPFVTFGEPYSPGDYVVPDQTGTHAGYRAPLHYWVPSVAPTALTQVPTRTAQANWGNWSGQLLMGTLRAESLVRIDLDASNKVRKTELIPIGARIRDMEFDRQGRLLATTDDGDLLVITPR
jgi:hypothetical protein